MQLDRIDKKRIIEKSFEVTERIKKANSDQNKKFKKVFGDASFGKYVRYKFCIKIKFRQYKVN